MLGSKKEKFASIFQRLEGLIQNGVIPYEQRPVWYDVYKAFPPRQEPIYNRPVPENVIRPILYPEDVERAEAFRRYKRLSPINAFKMEDDRSSLSRLLKQYGKLRAAHPEMTSDQLFTLAEQELQKEGTILVSSEYSVQTAPDRRTNVFLMPQTFQDLVFLGTASGYPSPHRGASGIVLRNSANGDHWLFDCGEGTQIQAQRSPNVRIGRISHIFISHLHGDHMYGLPGLLCTIDQKGTAGDSELPTQSDTGSKASVNIFGPKGLRRFLRLALALSRSRLNYTYAVHELVMRDEHRPDEWTEWASLEADPSTDPPLHCERPGRDIEAQADGFWYDVLDGDAEGTRVHAMALRHTIPSVGWLILQPDQKRSLCVEKARSLGVPDGHLMGLLKKGQAVTVDGKTVEAEQVLLPPVRGHRIAILGDSYESGSLKCLVQSLVERGLLSSVQLDVLVHEATFQNSMAAEAVQKGHSTPERVADLATELDVQLLILTHFSHRYSPVNRDEVEADQTRASKRGDKPSLQILLDEVHATKFQGQTVLADDLALIRVPPVPR